jgi:hypothetical protein
VAQHLSHLLGIGYYCSGASNLRFSSSRGIISRRDPAASCRYNLLSGTRYPDLAHLPPPPLQPIPIHCYGCPCRPCLGFECGLDVPLSV